MALGLAIKILNKQIVVKFAPSVNGFTIINDTEIGFGTVEALMPNNNNYVLGDSVCFKLKRAEEVVYNSVNYFIISESDILFIEPPIAP